MSIKRAPSPRKRAAELSTRSPSWAVVKLYRARRFFGLLFSDLSMTALRYDKECRTWKWRAALAPPRRRAMSASDCLRRNSKKEHRIQAQKTAKPCISPFRHPQSLPLPLLTLALPPGATLKLPSAKAATQVQQKQIAKTEGAHLQVPDKASACGRTDKASSLTGSKFSHGHTD